MLLLFFGYQSVFGQQNKYNIFDFGALANDQGDDTKAIQLAIDHCTKNGGGTVFFPPGTWLSGTVFLKSNVTIYLDNGSVWQGVNDSSGFPFIEPVIPSREDEKPRRAMVYAYEVENVKITGEGTFYPGGDYEMYHATTQNKKYHFRPYGIFMVKSKGITISNIKMKNSAFWMQRYFYCDEIILEKLNIYNHVNLNNDGIDIDGCHNVIINNCLIDSSDDALVIKSEGMRTSENVTVTNCILSSHATPLKLGTSSIGGYRRITISNIVIRPSKSQKMIHPLKAWGGLGGIDLLNVDGGIMQDILINNVVIDSVETPIFIRFGERHSGWQGKPESPHGISENIILSNIIARNASPISSSISGYPNHRISNVKLSDIMISVTGSTDMRDTVSLVEENSKGYPVNRMYRSNLPSYGFFIRHVDNIQLNNVNLLIQEKEVRPGIFMEDVLNADLRGLNIDQPESNQPKLKIMNSHNILIETNKGITKEDIIHSGSSDIKIY